MIAAVKETRAFDAGEIRRGLAELAPDISFDAVVNRPSDNFYVLEGGDHMEEERGGVYHLGRFICAMDRGIIGEDAVWEMADGFREIDMSDIERYDDTKVVYFEILPTDPNYHFALLKAQEKHDNYQQDGDGRLFRYQALRQAKVPSRILKIGWRSLFATLISRGIPGVTQQSIFQKFGVRM